MPITHVNAKGKTYYLLAALVPLPQMHLVRYKLQVRI